MGVYFRTSKLLGALNFWHLFWAFTTYDYTCNYKSNIDLCFPICSWPCCPWRFSREFLFTHHERTLLKSQWLYWHGLCFVAFLSFNIELIIKTLIITMIALIHRQTLVVGCDFATLYRTTGLDQCCWQGCHRTMFAEPVQLPTVCWQKCSCLTKQSPHQAEQVTQKCPLVTRSTQAQFWTLSPQNSQIKQSWRKSDKIYLPALHLVI